MNDEGQDAPSPVEMGNPNSDMKSSYMRTKKERKK